MAPVPPLSSTGLQFGDDRVGRVERLTGIDPHGNLASFLKPEANAVSAFVVPRTAHGQLAYMPLAALGGLVPDISAVLSLPSR